MIKDSLKQIVRDGKEKVKYLKYKSTLPKNPMHDDIYIVEFPKSGITWLQHILVNIELELSEKKEYITFYNHQKYMPDIHQLRGAKINRFFNRTFIKSHSIYNPHYYFVIYLIRNPFDLMVSYYNFMLGHGYKGNFDTFVKNKNFGILKWKQHINSWFDNKVDAQKIHLIRYEDLMSNPKKEIQQLYKNIGLELNDAVLKSSLNLSTVEYMKSTEENYREKNPNFNRYFVGKENKIKKSDIMTEEIENYIREICYGELEKFYPDHGIL